VNAGQLYPGANTRHPEHLDPGVVLLAWQGAVAHRNDVYPVSAGNQGARQPSSHRRGATAKRRIFEVQHQDPEIRHWHLMDEETGNRLTRLDRNLTGVFPKRHPDGAAGY
jgi:hypothetical protein